MLEQFAGLTDVGFDFFGRSLERVRLTLPEVVDQVNNLVRLQFSGYRINLNAARRQGARFCGSAYHAAELEAGARFVPVSGDRRDHRRSSDGSPATTRLAIRRVPRPAVHGDGSARSQ